MPFDPNSLIRPSERRAAKRQRRSNVRHAKRHPDYLTKGEFGQGLKRSGQSAGQNFRAAAKRRMTTGPNAITDQAELQRAIQSAVKGRRYQRSQIASSNLTPAQKALAKRRLQAQDINYNRRATGSQYGQIRVRTSSEIKKRRR